MHKCTEWLEKKLSPFSLSWQQYLNLVGEKYTLFFWSYVTETVNYTSAMAEILQKEILI